MEPPQGRMAKDDGEVRRDRRTNADALASVRRLGVELDRLDDAVAALRATRLRQLAAARSRPPGPAAHGSPAPDP